jgi:hypothetical protein
MRKLLLLFSFCLVFFTGCTPVAFAQASPYNLNVYKSQSFTATGQTGAIVQLNGLVIPSTVGSSYASGTITLTGTAITTVSFRVMGSSDNGATYYALPVYSVASPSTPPVTTVTATAAGQYQFNLAGMTHIKLVTTGTFTATSVSLTLTGSPNASISRNSSGSGGASLTTTSPQAFSGPIAAPQIGVGARVLLNVGGNLPGTISSLDAGGGGTIMLSPGMFTSATQIALPDDGNCVNLEGSGKSRTTIQLSNSIATAFLYKGSNNSTQKCFLRDLTVDANGLAPYACQLLLGKGWQLDNLRCINGTTEDLAIGSAGSGAGFYEVKSVGVETDSTLASFSTFASLPTYGVHLYATATDSDYASMVSRNSKINIRNGGGSNRLFGPHGYNFPNGSGFNATYTVEDNGGFNEYYAVEGDSPQLAAVHLINAGTRIIGAHLSQMPSITLRRNSR